MIRAFLFGVATAIVVALVVGYFVLRNGIIPANADATPGWLETWAAETSLDATLRREAQGTNPVPMTDEDLIAAIKLYGQHCAICHGTAKGDPSASPVAKGLYPRPPQLASDGVGGDPEGFSFWKIKHGIRWTGMPSWRGTLTDQQILEPCCVPQAHGQAPARRRTGMAKCRELRLTVMEISIHSLLEGATLATGSVAVIDVFRAFTTAAVALANGASKIVLVRTVEEALALREAGIGQICMGEVGGKAPDGFDFGNSPFEISGVDFSGKGIIQRTSAGTQGIVAAGNRAVRLYAASLVTAEATVRAILAGSADQVCLVAMGDNGVNRTDEDELCAIHLRNRLEGRPGDPEAIRRLILAGGEVGRFHDPARPYLHPEDVDIALDIDRFDFALRVEFEDGRSVARMERPA